MGPEQEYFLDKEDFARREDLRFTGRTLFGAPAPKGQELDDHYFGAIRPRVAAYMKDLDEALWRLGILSKTKHNEVAPAQHEMAPVYTDANTACDANQLVMEIMKKDSRKARAGLPPPRKALCRVNGSGKHDNWSLNTDTGKNLFKPGRTPRQNAQFLVFLSAFIKGETNTRIGSAAPWPLPVTTTAWGPTKRLPAIVSIFLGTNWRLWWSPSTAPITPTWKSPSCASA